MITTNFNVINTFEDIDFEPHKSDDSGVQSLITFNDFDLSLIGGDNFYGDGQSTFEIAFLDKSTKDIISGYDLLDMNNEDIVRVNLKNWGKELKKKDIVSLVGVRQIMAIINSKKKQASLNNSNKKMKTDDTILKDISDDLVKIAMMPKEYRVSGILNLKLLVDDLDEDNIPKEQVDLIKSIVNDLIDEVKNPQVEDEEIEVEVEVEDEEVDLDADICALNDLLDDAFDVDDVDELNDLLNCEVAKIEPKAETLSKDILAQEFDLLNRSNEMGYRFLENTEDNEKLIEFHRDFVDEETGDVISVGVNKEKKFLIAKDDAQADRWNDWVLNN